MIFGRLFASAWLLKDLAALLSSDQAFGAVSRRLAGRFSLPQPRIETETLSELGDVAVAGWLDLWRLNWPVERIVVGHVALDQRVSSSRRAQRGDRWVR
jgi:hypothetical protein